MTALSESVTKENVWSGEKVKPASMGSAGPFSIAMIVGYCGWPTKREESSWPAKRTFGVKTTL